MNDRVFIVVPHYEGDDAEEHERLFWERHDSDPDGIVIVLGSTDNSAAAFRTYAAAIAHANSLEDTTLVIPLRLDEPAWGNVVMQ